MAHGNMKHGRSLTPTYWIWAQMRYRCLRPKCPAFKYYGAKGVKIHQPWLSFETFLADMGECPAGYTLGRILDLGNYEPGNVFWMTRSEQNLAAKNKRALKKAGLL